MKKRLLAAVLCLAMLITCVPSFAFRAQATELPVITCNGSAQSSVSFPRNERITLTAEGGSWYQWQIKVNDSLWVNISGETGETLDVSYAMIANLCQGDTAYLRVAADGERFSDPVAVTAGEAVIKEAAAPAAASYVIQAAPQAVVSDSSTDSSTGSSANSEAVAQAQAALTAAEAAANEAAEVAAAAEEDASAKQTAYYEAQNKADAAKQAMEASAVTTEIPAETSAEEVDENGNPVVIKPAETVVTYDPELQAAYAAAQAEADAAWQVYSAAAITLADAEANLQAAQDAVETAAAELEAIQNQPTGENSGRANFALEREGEGTTTYNVVIYYVFQDGSTAAQPYIANLAAGTNHSATVNHPTVQGYLPYVGESAETSDKIELNITNIQADVTYTVTYKPTNVNYTVIHYQQNLDDDNYTEAVRETKQGLTNSTVGTNSDGTTFKLEKEYEGFYALLYEKPVIAADGSTKVEIYYDRYYYLMNFDLDGGYGVEPIYARYGTPIGDVGTPTKAGYSFGGWSLDGVNAVALPTQMPAENRIYKAIWTMDNAAKVTVVFWGENADDEEYSYIKSAEVYVKPGTDFTYSEDGTKICVLEEHTHSISNNCYQLTCTQEEHTHSDSCYTCGGESHTHDTTCYEGVGNQQNAYTGLPDTPSEGEVVDHWRYGKLIYIKGNWYRYSGSTNAGSIAPTICGKTEGTHTHTDACLGCGKTEHTHSVENGCYTLTCTKTEHTHNSNCYMNGAGLDSNLWTFVKSETVTVAADGSSVVNVYYDRTTFTLTFKDGNNTVATITDKWGADISDEFNKAPFNTTYNGRAWECTEKSKYNYALQTLDRMPQFDATFTLYNKSSNTLKTIYYYLENVGANVSENTWPTNQSNFTLLKTVQTYFNYATYDEEYHEIEGFTRYSASVAGFSGNQKNFSNNTLYLYYLRNDYQLKFNDGYNDVRIEEKVQYEAPLSTYIDYVPEVPSAYEPGSVQFGGWYLNPECNGDEYKLSEHTMPLGNLILYAKWVPVTHTVRFYLDADALSKGTELESHPAITVPHGSFADPTPEEPTNGNYTFVGWFYMENGVEKAFDFENMPVKKDLQVYGKWSSNTLKPYTIYYKIQDTDTEIADKTTGSGLAGVTKTFDAKGGTDLYADYQEGYFPVTKSHSMTLDINATEENNTNAYTFWYVQKDAVPYTVYYVTESQNANNTLTPVTINGVTYYMVAETKTVSDNRKAVVTETFVPVNGMMPDAYQKRLVVSVDENGNPDTAHNVIIFFYTEDTTHAYYKITHYTENLGTDTQGNPTWTEYASSQAVGDIGSPYEGEPMTIPGFTYSTEVTGDQYKGVLTGNGLELKLYYTRNSYPYQVRYLEQGTGDTLATPKNGTGKYGQVISESAIDIDNYTAVDPTSQTLNIKIETPNDQGQIVAALNVITFYYTENQATINYVVVGPTTDCGTVSPASETLKVLSGTAQGSTATASSNTYKFVGWYEDAACTEEKKLSTDAHYTPTKADGAAWVDGTTYYAKFEYNLTTLTITKSGALDDNDGFIFDVTGNGESFTVSVKGNGSVTIAGVTVGETYTITERSDWAWRYSVPSSQTITLVADGATNTVRVENSAGKPYLLDGSAYKQNISKPSSADE